MKALIKIAFRNLKQNKSKTLIIGLIIALGITLLITGNSMLETSSNGIKKSFIDNFTGNIIIREKTEGTVSLMGPSVRQTIEGGTPSISDYSVIYQYLSSNSEIEMITSQITGRALINYEGKEDIPVTLFGIEPATYSEMFNNNIDLIEGSMLGSDDKESIVLSKTIADRIKDENSIQVNVNDSILLTSFTSFGIKIRQVTVKGIYSFKNSNEILNSIGFLDAETLRSLLGMNLTASRDVDLNFSETEYIDFEIDDQSIDSLFSDDIISLESSTVYSDVSLGDNSVTREESFEETIESGSWHFILIKLKNDKNTNIVINDINTFIEENSLNLITADWLGGAGAVGRFAYVIQFFFNIIILIISVVAVIIIMNTLVISIIERINEIGTMRAMGAGRGFVMNMIITENLMISGIFGIIGIAFGSLIILLLNLTGINAPNIFFEILFGGKILYPELSINIISQALGTIFIISILSSIYPVIIALRIQPVKAMSE
jgi:putative ABC transport system permease protein